MQNDENKLKIVPGDGKDLNLSPVYSNLKDIKSRSKKDKKKDIVIPNEKNISINNKFSNNNKN